MRSCVTTPETGPAPRGEARRRRRRHRPSAPGAAAASPAPTTSAGPRSSPASTCASCRSRRRPSPARRRRSSPRSCGPVPAWSWSASSSSPTTTTSRRCPTRSSSRRSPSSRWPARACSPTRSTSPWRSSTTCWAGPAPPHQPNRPMTAMETTITTHLLDRLLREFAATFGTITEVQPVMTGFEYNPQLAQAASGSDTVMVANFAMGVGSREGEATLVLPFSSFASGAEQRRLAAAVGVRAAQAQARRRGAGRPAQPRAGGRQRAVRTADGLLRRPALPRRRRRPPAAPPAGRPLEVTTNDATFAYAIASNHRRRLAAAIVPTPHAAAKDTA